MNPILSSQTGSHPSIHDRVGRFQPRGIGVEIEFTGIGVARAGHALQSGLGGQLERDDPHAYLMRGTRLGDLSIQLDIRYVHPQAHGDTVPFRLGRRSAALLGHLVQGFVPRELILSPLPETRLPEIDEVAAMLRLAGARGRGRTWFASLGMHFNIGLPHPDALTLLRMLRAFLLLEPWLRREASGPGVGRSAFAPGHFPQAYVRRVMSPDYRPGLPAFTDDYLAANPTRNRALDLLPVLQHFDEARVRTRLPFEKISSRPALHYRLPLAYVGDPSWSIMPDWRRWNVVERLADDPVRLDALARAYLEFHGSAEAWMQLALPQRGAG
jgi:hypothetical protein